MDLSDLLARNEGKTLEFKRDLSSPAPVLRTLVAFANTAGGTLLFGVEDATRDVIGVTDPLALAERLTNMASDSIEPRLVPEIEILPWRKKYLVGVEVYPSPSRPHHIARDGQAGGIYVRVGSTNRRADDELIAEMRRSVRGESFDEQPVPELDSEALDFRVASESFAPVRKLRPKDLATLRLVTTHQGRTVPTVGGILLFGTDRERQFPDAWIQAGRFDGTDKSRIIDRTEIHSDPVHAVQDAITFVQKHAMFGAEIGSVKRTERWSVPPVALREAVINAVAHADYAQRGAPIRVSVFDDRVEVENPGLLPFGLTIDDLERGVSKLRNRVIGRVFHELGLIEQWGSGVQRMISACRDAGLAPPTFEELGHRFRVTLHTDSIDAPKLDVVDQAIVNAISESNGLTTAQISAVIALTPRTTRTRLAKLRDRGLIREIGSGPNERESTECSELSPSTHK